MALAAIACTRCRTPVPREAWNHVRPAPCERCGTKIRADVFRAHFSGLAAGAASEAVVADGDASCFDHPSKRAVLPCDACGRFLCALCDVEFRGRHLCPTCLESQKRKGELSVLETERTLYDRIALSLAVYPLLIFYLTILTAPAAIFISLRYWKAPGSIVRGKKPRFVAAIVLSLAQIAGWIALAVFLVTLSRRAPSVTRPS